MKTSAAAAQQSERPKDSQQRGRGLRHGVEIRRRSALETTTSQMSAGNLPLHYVITQLGEARVAREVQKLVAKKIKKDISNPLRKFAAPDRTHLVTTIESQMLIPYYWAESRLQTKSDKQVTVKRWGWSDISQEDAQAMADRRGQEAMTRILNGENLRRREIKDSYGTQDGVPIREEVVSRHGKIAVTRNSYGSLCLNTPNVFFADVDAQWHGALRVQPSGFLCIVMAGIIAGIWQQSLWLGAGIAIGVPWIWSQVNRWINHKRRLPAESKVKQENLAAIRAFAAAHPQWHLRVYETPAGYRLLAVHDVFDPQGEVTRDALKALNSDKRFATLCALQSCFRARVSPKYWRAGYHPKEHLPKSKWPFPPEHLPRRQAWVAGYDKAASLFASCRFVERLGSHVVHPDAEAVREIHDRLSQSDSSLPLA